METCHYLRVVFVLALLLTCAIPSTIPGDCLEGSIQLVDGLTLTEGRVEVCKNGTWRTLCGHRWSDRNAEVVCRQLGLQTNSSAALLKYGRGNSSAIITDVFECAGDEANLQSCPVCSNNCSIHAELGICADHSMDAGVNCTPGMMCNNGDIRLANGPSRTEGRLDVCQNGHWQTTCGLATSSAYSNESYLTFSDYDTTVACRQLGFFNGTRTTVRFDMLGSIQPAYSDIMLSPCCAGDESRLTECSTLMPGQVDTYCWPNTDVAIQCQECPTNNVRIVGGPSETEGRVEICMDNGGWGTICSTNWDSMDALVLCRQLGLTLSMESSDVSSLQYGMGNGPIFLDNIDCLGDEDSIFECQFSNQPSVACMDHSMDIGVNCSNVMSTAVAFTSTSLIAIIPTRTSIATTRIGDSSIALVSITITTNIHTLSSTVTNFEFTTIAHPTDSSIETDSTTAFTEGTTLQSATVSLTALIGGGIGGAVVIVLAIIVSILIIISIVICRHGSPRRRALLGGDKNVGDLELVVTNPYYEKSATLLRDVYNVSEEDTAKLMIHNHELRLLDCIGQGEFGIVYKAHLITSNTAHWSQTNGREMQSLVYINSTSEIKTIAVAVKTLKGSFTEEGREELLRESMKMHNLDHPNILNLIGICLDAGPAPYMVMPFMANGSLQSYLKKERDNLLIDSDADEDVVSITRKRLTDMCLQVAKGMEYLSNQRIIHRDLAARNCMIDVSWVIKVADFGLAETMNPTKDYFRPTQDEGIKLPVKWMAPESLNDGLFSEKTEVWSYGVTCWEIFSAGKIPYPGVHPRDVIRQLEGGLRPDRPKNSACSDGMHELMNSCWEYKAESRPHFSEVVAAINRDLEALADYMNVRTFIVTSDT